MKNNYPKIKYFDLYSLRKEKGDFLESHDVKNTKWQELELKEPNFWFVPKDMRGEKTYDKFISVKDIFEKYNAGIATGKDEILVDFDEQALIRKLAIYDKDVFKMTMQNHGISKDLVDVWYDELKNEDIENQIEVYNYRIFDKRFVVYNNKILQRARTVIMNNFLKDNLALVTTKILSSKKYKHAFISNCISDRCLISNRGREANYYFPLYLYNIDDYAPKNKKAKSSYGNLMLFDKPKEKEANIKNEIVEKLSESYKKEITPKEIFYYIYAVLYSDIYRKKYNEFLKIDFPKIPFTKDAKLFNKISKSGKELADLHLLKSDKLENDKSIKFPAVGNNKVEKREYKDNKIYINDKQYFVSVTPEVWNYYIGGYQVLDKWLKDRRDKVLLNEDVNHYLKVITALKLTIEAQKEIDELYGEVEKTILKK
ncbi:MAG: hypothetical protein KAQ87_01200 [Candidatus Pacebacteria bacterium]|nr:hypothetical protein [Candidatus Paceibacterota bacterium]